MKEAIGGTSLFLIVIVILSVFAIYISLSVNWTTAYKVKDEIIFYIEKNQGVNKSTLTDINNYLADVGYFNYGECPKPKRKKGINAWRGYNFNSNSGWVTSNPLYCIAKVNLIKNTESSTGKMKQTSTTSGVYDSTRGIDRSYYSVRTFFLVDLPIIRSLGLTIDGETKVILEPKDFKGLPAFDLSKDQSPWEGPRE